MEGASAEPTEPRGGRWLALLLAAALLLTVGTAGWGDLYNETDGQYGSAAKIMAGGGSWWIPENNGSPRLVKPPLVYWAMAASFRVFGVNEFAARLPHALAITAWVAVTFLIGTHLAGAWRGFLAGLILLTALGTFTLGRIIMPEPMFAAWIAGALYCLLRGQDAESRRRRWYLGFWLCAALASFTKGWHGLLYPLAIAGTAAFFCRDARPRLRGLISWQGLLLFAAINIPWYLFLESRFPGFLHDLVFNEQLGHVTGSDAPATSYSDVPRWLFVLLHAAWFFPWSVLAVAVLFTDGASKPRRVCRFSTTVLIAWVAVVFGSVLLTGERQDYYAMAMWPAFALGVAAVVDGRSHRLGAVAVAVVLALALGATFFLPTDGASTASVAERATAASTVTQFDASVWRSLLPTAWVSLGGALVCCAAAMVLRGRPGIIALAGAASCLALGAVSGTSIVSPYFSLAQAAPVIRAQAGVRLVYDGGLDTGSSLLFYTDQPVVFLGGDPDFFAVKFGFGRDRRLSGAEFVALWRSGQPVVFVTEASALPAWEERLGGPLRPMTRCGTQVVLKNSP